MEVTESTKNIFDLWVDTQNKVVENWVESTKKFQEAAKQGDVLQQGSQVYKQWFETQKNLMNNMFEKSSDQATESAPDFMKEWAKQQREFTSRWIEMINNAVNVQNMNPDNFLRDSKKIYDNWLAFSSQAMGKGFAFPSFGAQPSFVPGNFSKDMFSGMINTSKTYAGLFEAWQPFYKLMSEGRYNFDEYAKMFNADKYKETLQSIFNFATPDMSKNFFGQISDYMNTYRDTFRTWNYPFKDIYELYSKTMPGVMPHDFNALHQFQNQMSDQMKKITDPFMKMVPPGKSKEMYEGMTAMQEMINNYQVKYAEMQYIISQTSQKAIEKSVKTLFEQAKEGKKMESYNQFFNVWVNTMEEGMVELFNSEHFGKLQAELLSISLDIKSGLEKNMEHALAPLPVAPRSEVDTLCKQLHELKAKVKMLEQQLGQQDNSNSSEEEAARRGNKKISR